MTPPVHDSSLVQDEDLVCGGYGGKSVGGDQDRLALGEFVDRVLDQPLVLRSNDAMVNRDRGLAACEGALAPCVGPGDHNGSAARQSGGVRSPRRPA